MEGEMLLVSLRLARIVAPVFRQDTVAVAKSIRFLPHGAKSDFSQPPPFYFLVVVFFLGSVRRKAGPIFPPCCGFGAVPI